MRGSSQNRQRSRATLRVGVLLSLWLHAGAAASEDTTCPLRPDDCAALLTHRAEPSSAPLDEPQVTYREVSGEAGFTLIASGDLVLEAAAPLVWDVLGDFEAWPRFIPNLEAVEIEPAGEGRWRVREYTRAIGMRFSFTTLRTVDPSLGLLWEHLDRSQPSDFAGVSSFWQMLPLAADRTLVRLHTRIAPGFYIPGFLRRNVLGSSVPQSLRALADEVARRADLAVAAR